MRNPQAVTQGRRARPLTWVARIVLLFVAMLTCGTAGLLLVARWQQARLGGAIAFAGADPSLGAAERLYLEAYLAANVEALSRPIAPGEGVQLFVVTPGESANDIAANLLAAGLLADSRVFLSYLRYYGLDADLEAGTFEINPNENIPQLAQRLARAYGQEVELRFLEGWRAEEMADYLAATAPAQIDAVEFLTIVRGVRPIDRSGYGFLSGVPADASLEGFLFPDTYRIGVEGNASDLVQLMLKNFERRLTPDLRGQMSERGLTLQEAVTLASIVEREAVLASERPLIAAVFLNRLQQQIPLQADPTVQYAVGYDPQSRSWWKSPLSAADLEVDSPYNTYVYGGLPPGPIANPGLDAMRAVASPATTGALFFVADCTADGAHLFSDTYAEHLDNVGRCR